MKSQFLNILILFVILYYIWRFVQYYFYGCSGSSQPIYRNKMTREHFVVGECPTCPSCPTSPACPTCPVCPPNQSKDVENLTLLSKYLTLIIRKNEVQDEIFRLQQGHARVYTSPKLELINRQIAEFKTRIKDDPITQRFFQDNLDSSIITM